MDPMGWHRRDEVALQEVVLRRWGEECSTMLVSEGDVLLTRV